ncbi:MAG: aminotransferase [Alphaproteobacteria bacterium]|nr:aminotransferase [Alphaproteobacteria bacterium]
MKSGNSILSSFGVTVFETMSRLAVEKGAINLGQGFPEGNGPDAVVERARAMLTEESNQYPPMLGVPELRQAVADHGKRFYGLDIDWQTETMVTTGATEALAATMLGLIEPGDEVVLIEPLYDCYIPMLRRAGAIPKLVQVSPPHWDLPVADLEAAITEKTKFILVNSPQNPAAKVYSRSELQAIADLCVAHDLYAVCDEAYEHLCFDGRPHLPLIGFPGMRDRTVKIGSAGKTFSATGWKVGYITAAAPILKMIAKAHQYLVFTTAPNLQRAVAYGLSQDKAYFEGFEAEMGAKRDRLAKGLEAIGFRVLPCEGTYFINADIRPLGFEGGDVAFCEHLINEVGVAAIPVSVFYQDEGGDLGSDRRSVVRFCFAKSDETLDRAIDALKEGLKRKVPA